jgi:predicted transcriptional regulator YdeE
MQPEIIQRKKLLLAGITNCGKDVTAIDILGLWSIYDKSQAGIPNRIEGTWYELHIGNELGHGIYSVTAGAEVNEIGELPVEVSMKVVPAGRYAHFAHCMKDGGFDDAFAKVEAWVEETGTEVRDFGLQLLNQDFDPQKNDSTLHIYIPLSR